MTSSASDPEDSCFHTGNLSTDVWSGAQEPHISLIMESAEKKRNSREKTFAVRFTIISPAAITATAPASMRLPSITAFSLRGSPSRTGIVTRQASLRKSLQINLADGCVPRTRIFPAKRALAAGQMRKRDASGSRLPADVSRFSPCRSTIDGAAPCFRAAGCRQAPPKCRLTFSEDARGTSSIWQNCTPSCAHGTSWER